MRIGIDARLYNQTGVGRYIRNLISHLEILDKKNEYFIYLRKEEYSSFSPINNRWHKRLINIPWHTFREQMDFPRVLLADQLDVAHFPYFNVPILYLKKYLLTIHDLIIDHFDTGRASRLPLILYKGKRIGYKLALSYGIKKASWITAISETTKNEIVNHYHVSPSAVTITHDALDSHFLNTTIRHKPKKYFDFSYLIYVGNAYPHKNLECLLKAFKIVRSKEKIKLVLVGDDKYFYPRLKKYAAELGISSEVVFFGNANDEELVNLYTYCKLLVFPSLMEGFGLPNLEAVTCGKLCVVSDIPAFREVWGDSLVFFDLKNINDFVIKILYVLHLNKEDYQERLKEAKKKIKRYNWERTALETLKIYEKISQV